MRYAGPNAESAVNLNPMCYNIQQGNILPMLQRFVNPSVLADIPHNAQMRSFQLPAQLYMACMSMIQQPANPVGLNEHHSGNFPNQDQRMPLHNRHEIPIVAEKAFGKIDPSKGNSRTAPPVSERLDSAAALEQTNGGRPDQNFPNTVSTSNSQDVLRAVLFANPIAGKALKVYKVTTVCLF